jgi:hypothetical protein
VKPYLIGHHSGDSSSGFQFDKINAYHRRHGYPKSSLGFYGGYQFLIEKDGTRRQYREIKDRGAHTDAVCGEDHCNLNGIGVCLAGDFTKETPTEAQLWALYHLSEELKAMGHASVFVEHRELKRTTCPAFDLRGALERKRREDLARQLKIAVNAIPRLFGPRLQAVLRWIERLKRYLSIPPTP